MCVASGSLRGTIPPYSILSPPLGGSVQDSIPVQVEEKAAGRNVDAVMWAEETPIELIWIPWIGSIDYLIKQRK